MRGFVSKWANDRKKLKFNETSTSSVFSVWPHPSLYPVSCVWLGRHKSSVWNGITHFAECHICLHLKSFFFFYLFCRENTWKTQEGRSHWKVWFNWKCLHSTPASLVLPYTSGAPTPSHQSQCNNQGEGEESVWGGENRRGGMVLLDPWGRQRWKECAVQPVNTLTQGVGGGNLLTAFPPSHFHPPIVSTRKDGERDRRGGGVRRDGRRRKKMQTAEKWKTH